MSSKIRKMTSAKKHVTDSLAKYVGTLVATTENLSAAYQINPKVFPKDDHTLNALNYVLGSLYKVRVLLETNTHNLHIGQKVMVPGGKGEGVIMGFGTNGVSHEVGVAVAFGDNPSPSSAELVWFKDIEPPTPSITPMGEA